ncbi:MAG: NAD(P)/FAD-dependent oxidoreductase [Gaiellaceae bacterium]
MSETVLIVGAGLAGTRCAETLRNGGFAGPIVLVGEEPVPPYERPALSKEFLAGNRDDPALRPASHWDDLGIELRLGAAVSRVDLPRRTASLGDEDLPWDHLVLATGARPRRAGGLRTLADARALRERLVPGTRLAVIGGGFVGTEVASTAISLGVDVSLVVAAETPFERVLGCEIGALLARRYVDHGVDLRLGTREIPAHDLLLWAVGVVPARELLPDLVVGSCGRTQYERVYACGDVTGSGHWTAAAGQGAAVAHAILGADRPFVDPPFFWSDQFGLRLQVVGEPTSAARVELEGAEDSFTARYLDAAGQLQGVLLANRAGEVAAARRALALAG